ncbi:MAG: DNA repair protein RecO [Candidatus Heimdallarchaeota archaeon]
MTKRSTYKACAFVLHTLDYGESDRIVTFYTDEFGKLKGIAKGARRSRKRFANAIDLFSRSAIVFSRKNNQGLAVIENCDVINYYPEIRADLEKSILASYFIELTDNFTVEGKKNPQLFQLVQDFLGLIGGGNNPEEITRFFELRLLKLSGYEPALERCHVCNTPLDKTENIFFSPLDGGIKCIKCAQNDVSSIPVSIGTIKMLLMGKEIETSKIHRLAFSKQSLKESSEILGSFIRHILGRKLNSLQILNKIRKMST